MKPKCVNRVKELPPLSRSSHNLSIKSSVKFLHRYFVSPMAHCSDIRPISRHVKPPSQVTFQYLNHHQISLKQQKEKKPEDATGSLVKSPIIDRFSHFKVLLYFLQAFYLHVLFCNPDLVFCSTNQFQIFDRSKISISRRCWKTFVVL